MYSHESMLRIAADSDISVLLLGVTIIMNLKIVFVE